VIALGHQVIVREIEVEDVGAVTASGLAQRARPDAHSAGVRRLASAPTAAPDPGGDRHGGDAPRHDPDGGTPPRCAAEPRTDAAEHPERDTRHHDPGGDPWPRPVTPDGQQRKRRAR
jgi:hypothetical protein